MTDFIRDRIAAAIRSALLEVDYSSPEESADGGRWVFIDGTVIPELVADAVIRELKLLDLVKKLEAEIAELLNRAKANPLNRDSLLDRATGMEQALFAVRRYVTEWENDD